MRSASSDGVTAIVERDCGECFEAVIVKDPRAGFSRDEHPCAGVPRVVAEQDADVEAAFGGPGQVDR